VKKREYFYKGEQTFWERSVGDILRALVLVLTRGGCMEGIGLRRVREWV
jgi:hypothetical protein